MKNDDERRRLLARATKAEEDAALCRERLAAAYREIAEICVVKGASHSMT